MKKLYKQWVGVELGKYRFGEEKDTYIFYTSSQLPSIRKYIKGDFSWLPQLQDIQKNKSSKFKKLKKLEKKLKITFPADFSLLMNIPNWEKIIQFNSPTGCYIPNVIDLKSFHEGHIFTIYNDQQDTFFWYLYFESNSNKSYVLCSRLQLSELLKKDKDDLFQHLYMVEKKFEAFIYRTHIENMLWYALNREKKQEEYFFQKSKNMWYKQMSEYLDFYDREKWGKYFFKISASFLNL